MTPLFRKIIHIDMDCFYAAVEERDHPEYRGKPLAVGGAPGRRGVLCTCNYPARRFGLHAAMPTQRALALCPNLILLPVSMEKYREVSQVIRGIFRQFTDLIEPLSLDEAYLDVTQTPDFDNSATKIAKEIKRQILTQLSLTASAGIGPNKFLAKVASDWRKPDGLMVITPEEVADFVAALPVEKLSGVGRVTAQKLHQIGLKTCQDLQSFTLNQLQHQFGKFGERLYQLCRGIDERPVEPHRIRRSLSVEQTFPADLPNPNSAHKIVKNLAATLEQRLSRWSDRAVKQQFVKIKFHDFAQTTAECLSSQINLDIFVSLLEQAFKRGNKPMRLIGLGVRFRDENAKIARWRQMSIWDCVKS